jgi:hypothetical protein
MACLRRTRLPISTGRCQHEKYRLRRRHPRLHRDPLSRKRLELSTADARSTRLLARAALRRALGAPAAANAAILGNADSPTLFARIPRAGVD